MNQRVVPFVQAFIAGLASTLVFHQGVLALLYLAGAVPRAPYDLRAVPPLGLPAVISLAFWGGVWGAAIWSLLKHVGGAAYWVWALVIGAIGPSAVALFIVFPLKGMPVAGGGNPGAGHPLRPRTRRRLPGPQASQRPARRGRQSQDR